MIEHIVAKLKSEREKAAIGPEELNEYLSLGPGWIESFEANETIPTVDFILAVVRALKLDIEAVFKAIDFSSARDVLNRTIAIDDVATRPAGANLRFRYNSFPATVFIPSATKATFDKVAGEFRDNLSAGRKTDAVVEAFMRLVKQWPKANPSDIWWFIMSRIYSDPYFHPASEAHRDFGQSWKRTAGWALERVVVEHYKDFLASHDIEIGIYSREEKERFLKEMKLNYAVQPNKADVLFVNVAGGKRHCFGVGHVKASIAERRQNDQNFSAALLSKNFFSPFITMDCKSSPSSSPINKGEFGIVIGAKSDKRGDKRKEFEEEGYYSGCFSFNANTGPTPAGQKATSRIFVTSFRTADDAFSREAIKARDQLFGR
jgi:transcriptional regulator with XRE-family HTH domain